MSEPTDMTSELESVLRADGDGPAARIDAASAQRLIAQAIDGAAAAPVAPLRVKRYGWLLAAALVITGSAAAMYAARPWRSEDLGSARRPAAPRAVEPAPAPEPVPTAVAAAPVEAPAAKAAVAQAPADRQAPAASSDSRKLDSAAAAAQTAAPEHGAGAGAVQDLLRRANRLRGQGRYRTAERTYLRAVAESPTGAPAYSARVAAAALRIERLNDPRGALQLYADALREQPRGALAPEIHEGMAQAYRKLGQPARERQALSALLDEQPDGPAAERARIRLEELTAEAR